MPTAVNEGLWRKGGMYGSALRDGKELADVVELTASVEIARIEVPLVGKTKQGYKPGRESRDGSLRIHEIDDAWHMEVFGFLTQSLDQRRANRNAGLPNLRPFQLQIKIDDPDALGYTIWQLEGVLLWRMQLGFQITDDIIDREFPITWEDERPIAHFERTGAINPATGLPAVVQYDANLAS